MVSGESPQGRETALPAASTWAVFLLPQSLGGFPVGARREPPTQAAWPGVPVNGGARCVKGAER